MTHLDVIVVGSLGKVDFSYIVLSLFSCACVALTVFFTFYRWAHKVRDSAECITWSQLDENKLFVGIHDYELLSINVGLELTSQLNSKN